ncbi:MAG: hypothetical protein BWK73_48550 [Thiothrix lacustris]|uniref:Outer membrane protein assembly factor BamE domain-containing protein n=1 Tax=Thiothrix lacustris TaxID=525917 RepID=A0A1Y1Q9B0_9GAMM|nr:MAG: hypothetical protein BWK73_48550 [Thiothrix lacustris]
MIKKLILTTTILTLLVGCSTSANRLTQVSPGMTKTQVISVFGNPESVTGQGNTEIFTYTLSNSWNNSVWNESYYIYFINGQVVKYGK